MRTLCLLVVCAALLAWAAPTARGQEARESREAQAESRDAAGGEGVSHEPVANEGAGHDAGPVTPQTTHLWPGIVVFLILIMFLMAAVIGPIVRAHMPPEMPITHSHDEPPGASHHHGETGAINPVPADVAHLEHPATPDVAHLEHPAVSDVAHLEHSAPADVANLEHSAPADVAPLEHPDAPDHAEPDH